jgi:FixJ family two-component response regulator
MSPHKSVVAIVDDDAGVLTGLKRVLGAHGFITETFNSGEAFLERYKAVEPVCVILDINLGGISGIETRRRLTARGAEVPVIYMSALDTATTRKEAAASGCAAFLGKPFSGNVLIDTIRMATSSFKSIQNKTADG